MMHLKKLAGPMLTGLMLIAPSSVTAQTVAEYLRLYQDDSARAHKILADIWDAVRKDESAHFAKLKNRRRMIAIEKMPFDEGAINVRIATFASSSGATQIAEVVKEWVIEETAPSGRSPVK